MCVLRKEGGGNVFLCPRGLGGEAPDGDTNMHISSHNISTRNQTTHTKANDNVDGKLSLTMLHCVISRGKNKKIPFDLI